MVLTKLARECNLFTGQNRIAYITVACDEIVLFLKEGIPNEANGSIKCRLTQWRGFFVQPLTTVVLTTDGLGYDQQLDMSSKFLSRDSLSLSLLL